MSCSLAQMEANKKNATRSTGPKTPEGKLKSRANSLKHGLTGAGIVLPHEDVEAIDARFETIAAEMKPRTELARQLVSRIALLTVKLDRSAEHEARSIAHKMRQAEAKFEDARLAEMENYYSWIAAEPATNARRLRTSPEGVQRLRSVLVDLRADLAHPEGHRWDWQRCEQLHHMLGLRPCDVPFSRARVLSDAIDGNFRNLNQSDGGDLDIKARQVWAVDALVALIDDEIARLDDLHARFDHEGLALDRAEAAQRALFDASREAVLARKYEAASERGLYRAIKEFREIQGDLPQVDDPEELETNNEAEMGSISPEPGSVESETVDRVIPLINLDPLPPNRQESADPIAVSRPDRPTRRKLKGR